MGLTKGQKNSLFVAPLQPKLYANMGSDRRCKQSSLGWVVQLTNGSQRNLPSHDVSSLDCKARLSSLVPAAASLSLTAHRVHLSLRSTICLLFEFCIKNPQNTCLSTLILFCIVETPWWTSRSYSKKKKKNSRHYLFNSHWHQHYINSWLVKIHVTKNNDVNTHKQELKVPSPKYLSQRKQHQM